MATEALRDDPGGAEAALRTIRAASGEALGELRATVGLLRGPAASEPRDPVAGLAQLDRIVGSAADSGLAVAVRVEGQPVQLPVVVDAAVHRIVQESITNVLRHAHATSAAGELRYEPGALTVRVTDDGRGGAANGSGYGIQGMRERVALLGGNVGEADDGGPGVEVVVAERPDVVLMDIRMPGVDGLDATRRIVGDDRLRDVKVVVLTTFDADEYVFEAIRIGAGRSNDEIASSLYISPATARTHVSRIMTKLHARDRSQLVVLAYENGLVTPGAS